MEDTIHEAPERASDDTTTSLNELLAARQAIEGEIAELRTKTVEDIKRYIAEFNITQAELFGKARKTLPPKFRDPATGKTWSGKGKPPAWIRDLDESQRDALKV